MSVPEPAADVTYEVCDTPLSEGGAWVGVWFALLKPSFK